MRDILLKLVCILFKTFRVEGLMWNVNGHGKNYVCVVRTYISSYIFDDAYIVPSFSECYAA